MHAELKVIHLVCAALFLGNVIVSGVWALLAERTRNHAIIQFSNTMVLITDALFTLTGAIGVVWTGHGMAVQFDGGADHLWIQWSYALLSFSGLFTHIPVRPATGSGWRTWLSYKVQHTTLWLLSLLMVALSGALILLTFELLRVGTVG